MGNLNVTVKFEVSSLVDFLKKVFWLRPEMSKGPGCPENGWGQHVPAKLEKGLEEWDQNTMIVISLRARTSLFMHALGPVMHIKFGPNSTVNIL